MASCLSSSTLLDPSNAPACVSLPRLRSALEASWDRSTAYLGAFQPGNPALGQCYPTARVVQWFFPCLEIASGEVDTGSALEWHFWNIDPDCDPPVHVDLTWQQFGQGSTIKQFKILDRHALGDSPPTIERCELLLKRVLNILALWPACGAAAEMSGSNRVAPKTLGAKEDAKHSPREDYC